MDKRKFIYTVLAIVICIQTIFLIQKDKIINDIENKVLQQKPQIYLNNVINGKTMKDYEKYIEDQFPFRNQFIYFKNMYSYLLGKREFRDIYISKSGRLFKIYNENLPTVEKNINFLNKISAKSKKPSKLLVIPSSSYIYKDELPSYIDTDSEISTITKIKKLTENFLVYNPSEILSQHKKEYIFFNTDHHWTQLGAKYVFEDLYNKKIKEKPKIITDAFIGSYYSKVMLPFIKPDKILSFESLKNTEGIFDGKKESVLYDKSKLDTKNKYQYFFNGDPAKVHIKGNGDKNILILKDSFSHNFIPFLINEYKNIHVLDPRYINFDINDYLESINIDELLYIFSLDSLNSTNLYNKGID